MHGQLIAILLVLAAVVSLGAAASAQVATSDEALMVAKNWVNLIIAKRGEWGGSPTAEVTGIQDLRKTPESRLLGYFCPVSPKGWVVVSFYKDLASVKAYSDTEELNPADEQGIAAYVKDGLDGMINSVEKQLGKPISQATSKEIEGTLNVSFRSSWKLLGGDRAISEDGTEEPYDPAHSALTANYAGGQVLTTTRWHQGNPYNLTCPAGSGCDHTIVGCVATAGAQVLRYWCWPPEGTGSPYDDGYDWKNMPNSASGSSSQEVKDAVAELNREVGIAVGMSYGCDASSADTGNMQGVYPNNFRYTATNWLSRYGWYWHGILYYPDYYYNADQWFDIIKGQLNANRVIQYRIDNHSIVCDGWQEVGSPTVKQYHMNYGWGGGNNAWYTLDALYQVTTGGSIQDEKMVTDIRPNCALGATIAGDYNGVQARNYPYWYFDMDATAAGYAWFVQGQGLQFLPSVVFRGNGDGVDSNFVFIDGQPGATTRLFTRGDQTKGILISGGEDRATIRMNGGGAIVLR